MPGADYQQLTFVAFVTVDYYGSQRNKLICLLKYFECLMDAEKAGNQEFLSMNISVAWKRIAKSDQQDWLKMLMAAYKWTLPMCILGEVCWDLEVCRYVHGCTCYKHVCIGHRFGSLPQLASFPGRLPLCSLDRIRDLRSLRSRMRSRERSGRRHLGHVCGQENGVGDCLGMRLYHSHVKP